MRVGGFWKWVVENVFGEEDGAMERWWLVRRGLGREKGGDVGWTR